MGYWGTHPLSGDTPMDVEAALIDALFTAPGVHRNGSEDERLEEKKVLREHLAEAVDFDYAGCAFVLPFLVSRYQIRIEDEVLSQRIRRMIGDGGAERRGYTLRPSNAGNNWNGFDSPQDYACQLDFLWNDLMTGKAAFSQLAPEMGLIETMLVQARGRQTGIINCP